MHRSRRIRGTSLATTVAVLALGLPTVAIAPSALAQEPTDSPLPAATDGVEPGGEPSAFCGILTADEASSALGVTLTVGSSSETDCSWDSDFQTSDISLIGSRDVGDLELDAEDLYTDGHALQVGGRDAWYSPDVLALFVDVGDDLLFTLELYGTPPDDLDLETAFTGLATLALPRLAAVPVPPEPTEVPEPSLVGDPILQGLVPTTVGDATMLVDVYTAGDYLASSPDDPDAQATIAALDEILRPHGKSSADVSFANGFFETDTSAGDLLAIRVAGADVATFQDALVGLFLNTADPRRESATIGGKQVTIITEGPPETASPEPSADPFDLPLPPSYVYPSGEVLWIVNAEEPDLSALFQLLP